MVNMEVNTVSFQLNFGDLQNLYFQLSHTHMMLLLCKENHEIYFYHKAESFFPRWMYSPPSITGGILGVECEVGHKDLGTQKTEGKTEAWDQPGTC